MEEIEAERVAIEKEAEQDLEEAVEAEVEEQLNRRGVSRGPSDS